ncbi:Cortexillin [Entamoeba marina]
MQVTDTILNKSINRTKVVEEQQLFAYKNYLNFVLSEEPYVIDITKDLQDGSILNRFLLNLCGKLVPQTKEKPTKDIEKIQNLSNIVQFLKDEGIKIYGSAEEIFNGDQKTILSLLYQLLYRYRLGECPVKMSDFSKWIRSVLKVDNINKFDLKQELSKGVVFAKMLNYIENDVVNIEQLNGNGLEIITLCIDTAYEKFNIPKLIIPKYVENQEIDDFCLYLYLTFFILKETDFEDNEILRDIVAGIRERKIQMRQSFRSRLSTTLYRLLENIEK